MDGKTASTWLLYGAYGYTGRLIAGEAVARGEAPVLAGRREAPLAELADRLGLPWRAFPLDDVDRLDRGLDGIDAILHAAGPFSATSRPVVEACLRNRVHYLDITGEIPVFEAIFLRDAAARERGIALLPGVGFDVVPTDCLAASLADALPGAARLELAFASLGGGPSPGTAKTMVEGLGRGGAIREGGRIRRVPVAWRTAEIPFRDRVRRAVTIPWGDVSTAYRSTGIPSVVVYMAVPERLARALRLARPVSVALRAGPVRRLVQAAVERTVSGPDEEALRTGRSQVWARAERADGRSVEGTAETPGGYALTAVSAVEAVRRVVGSAAAAGPAAAGAPGIAPAGIPPAGALTPSQAFGAGFLAELPGCDLEVGPVR